MSRMSDHPVFFNDSFLFICCLSYLKGLYSFGLLETHFYDQAEKVALEVRLFFSAVVC